MIKPERGLSMIQRKIQRYSAILLILLMLFESVAPAYAQVNTPAATPEITPEQQAIQNLPNAAAEDTDPTVSPSPSFSDPTSISSAVPRPPILVRSLAKRSYRANEKINVIVENIQSGDIETHVFNNNGEEVEFENFLIEEGSRRTVVVKPPAHFAPGKYKVRITAGGKTYEQDFTWGVLAINPNKSIYTRFENAKLAIGVLDDRGEMVCDAKLELRIMNHESGTESILTTENGSIKVNDSCQKKEVTITPDYESSYQIGSELGIYEMSLTAETENGIYTIDDSFEVRKSVPFDVERTTATRIFPPLPYPVDLDIIANQDFTGTVVDLVPGNFVITQSAASDFPFSEQKNYSSQAVESGVLGASSSAVLGLPFEDNYPINQEFGEHLRDPYERDIYSRFNLAGHDGVDFDTPSGTNIVAVDDGEVVLAGAGAYGITVALDHSWGRSYYGHLSKSKVKLGQKVKRGELIALSGNTGLSTGPHLHFGVKLKSPDMQNGYYGKTDPLPLLGLPSNLDPDNQVKLIYWNISVKKGEKFRLSYFYKAPNISPEFYKIGPLRFYEKGSNIFSEARQWQIAVDADGSGANTVSPTTGQISSSGSTYTFTFDPSEAMNSGGITITEPTANDWTVPQGTNGVAGYTTAVGTGNATVGNVLDNADVEDPTSPAGIWKEFDPDMCGSTSQDAAGDIVVDTVVKQEGTGSIECTDPSGAPDNNDAWGFIYDADQNWNTACNGGKCQEISWWQRAAVNTEAFEFDVNDTTDIAATPLVACTGVVTTANTWEYNTCDISGGTLTTVRSFGFSCTSNTCTPFETDNFWVDELLLGPGVPTFSGTSPWVITVRFLDLASTETVTLTYGSGGGSSGVTNSATEGVHTFTTASKTLVTGSYTNLSGGSPTVTLSAGPTLDQLLRHGAWFNGGVEQPFTF